MGKIRHFKLITKNSPHAPSHQQIRGLRLSTNNNPPMVIGKSFSKVTTAAKKDKNPRGVKKYSPQMSPSLGGGGEGGTQLAQLLVSEPTSGHSDRDAASREARQRSATREPGEIAADRRGGGETPSSQAPVTAHANIQDSSPFQTRQFPGRSKRGDGGPTVPLNRTPTRHPRVCQPFPNSRVTELPHHGNFHSVRRRGCQTPFHKEPVNSRVGV